jgi:hypothetical protein
MPDNQTTVPDYLHEADMAVQFVNTQMVLGAANRVWDILGTGGVSRICVHDMREQLTKAGIGDMPMNEAIMMREVAAQAFGCGNCGEQSAIAFMWLLRRGIRPLEWMRFTDADHAFVVIGRAWTSSLDWDVPKWGPFAVVCDPWKKKAYPADQLKSVWPGCTPTITYRVA